MQQVAETRVVRLITCVNYARDDIMTSGDICRRGGAERKGERLREMVALSCERLKILLNIKNAFVLYTDIKKFN